MRGLIASLAVAGILAALVFTLGPRLRPPTLRVALNVDVTSPEDAALVEGVAAAFEEREGRAGRWRVATAHQLIRPVGGLEIPKPCAHTMLRGLEKPYSLRSPDGTDLFPILDALEESDLISAWGRERGLKRIWERYDLRPVPGKKIPRVRHFGYDPDLVAVGILETGPDIVLLHGGYGGMIDVLLARFRSVGFDGPVFLPSRLLMWNTLTSYDGTRVVLARLKPAPPAFVERHPHPFAYVAYRGTLDYLDALDRNRGANPLELAPAVVPSSAFRELLDEPRVYEIRGGRLEPSK